METYWMSQKKNGKAYTEEEFLTEYGRQQGPSKWMKALKTKSTAAGKMHVQQSSRIALEKRLGADGKWYTETEFIKEYGTQQGPNKWNVAKRACQQKQCHGNTQCHGKKKCQNQYNHEEEKRKAKDGNYYTLKQFLEHAPKNGKKNWDAAERWPF